MGHICYRFWFNVACVFHCPLSCHVLLFGLSRSVPSLSEELGNPDGGGPVSSITDRSFFTDLPNHCMPMPCPMGVIWRVPLLGLGFLLSSKSVCCHCILDIFILGSYHTKLFLFFFPPLRPQKCCYFSYPRTKEKPFLMIAFS